MKIVSHIISWLFVPLLTPVYGMLLAMFIPSGQTTYFQPNNLYIIVEQQKWSILYSYFFFCTIIPTLAILYLRNRGVITTLEVDERKERIIPILVMFMSCLGLYILFQFLPENVVVPKHIFSYPLAGVVVTAVLFIMTLGYKVSLHAGGVGIMTGFVVAYCSGQSEFQFWVIPASILVSGVVMSARLYLHKHTLSQVTVGWFTGAIITFTISYFL
ncbi:MAG: membrane-associated phospholipid phosphatase [Flavobacteriaceae bacterium]|jgi:membrane-associated phospholipid phosphatase